VQLGPRFSARSRNALAEFLQRLSQSPFRTTVTGKHPFVRLIGRKKPEEIVDYCWEYAQQIASWIVQGLQPWVFTHAPDDAIAPEIARWMHRLIGEEVLEIDPLKAWPTLPTLENSGLSKPTQLSLF